MGKVLNSCIHGFQGKCDTCNPHGCASFCRCYEPNHKCSEEYLARAEAFLTYAAHYEGCDRCSKIISYISPTGKCPIGLHLYDVFNGLPVGTIRYQPNQLFWPEIPVHE